MINLIHPFELAIAQLPVEPTDTQVLYIENHSNPALEQYIHDNYDKIVRQFLVKGLEFVYVPELTTRMSDRDFQNVASYYCPWLTKADVDSLRSACHIDLADLFHTVSGLGDSPAVVDAKGKAYSLDVSRPSDYDCLFYQIAHAYGAANYESSESSVMFSVSRVDEPQAEFRYSCRRKDLLPNLENAQEQPAYNLNECRNQAIVGQPDTDDITICRNRELDSLFGRIKNILPAWAIREALYKMLKDQEVISRLVITAQGKVMLPEYGNLEIRLTPKEKAMYFLFLRHPNGISLKDLPDHRQELSRYYGRVAKSGDKAAIASAIDKMTDPFSGDADTQRSRIKAGINRAFTGQFCEQFARWYTIEGERAHAMRIELPQDKIVWELDV